MSGSREIGIASALRIEGGILKVFVMANGVYVVAVPPINNDPQGYAIIATGIFVILATGYLAGLRGQEGHGSPPIR